MFFVLLNINPDSPRLAVGQGETYMLLFRLDPAASASVPSSREEQLQSSHSDPIFRYQEHSILYISLKENESDCRFASSSFYDNDV